ncbi:MAG: sigma-70 family RNA polymerase sigma factor [Bacteroides sp.]|nr:sigma-70 family RNA polymerase sigma factor [Bacteroides sp.]
MQDHDDTLLVARLRKGNIHAFETLYNRYSAKLYNSVSLLSYDKSLAKDITQSCFLTIWEKRDLLDPEKSFSSYIYTIARNLVYKETERLILTNKFVDSGLRNQTEAFEEDTIEHLNTAYLENYLTQLIAGLSELPRKIFLMKKERNLSTKEIATELGITERSVEAHFYRTLKYLKEKLRDYMMIFF